MNIAVIAENYHDQSDEVIKLLSKFHTVVTVKYDSIQTLNDAMLNNEVLYFNECSELLYECSHLPKRSRIVAYMQPEEMFTNLKRINWSAIDKLILPLPKSQEFINQRAIDEEWSYYELVKTYTITPYINPELVNKQEKTGDYNCIMCDIDYAECFIPVHKPYYINGIIKRPEIKLIMEQYHYKLIPSPVDKTNLNQWLLDKNTVVQVSNVLNDWYGVQLAIRSGCKLLSGFIDKYFIPEELNFFDYSSIESIVREIIDDSRERDT